MLLNLKTQNHKLIVVFFSVEPGFYEDGSFGIRIENVLLVKPVVLEVMTDDYWRFSLDTFLSFIIYLFIYLFIYFKPLLFFFEQNNFKNRGYLGFEPVTLVSMFISLPFMTKLRQLQPLTHKNRN